MILFLPSWTSSKMSSKMVKQTTNGMLFLVVNQLYVSN